MTSHSYSKIIEVIIKKVRRLKDLLAPSPIQI